MRAFPAVPPWCPCALSRLRRRWLLVAVAALAVGACRDRSPATPVEPVAPVTGAIRVELSLVLADGNPGTFAVRIDGGPETPIIPGMSRYFAGQTSGQHAVEIRSDLGCTGAGTSYPVTVTPGRIADLVVPVTCLSPGTGAIRALVVAPFGTFSIDVDDGPVRTAVAGGQLDFLRLAPGDRRVRATADVPHCRVADPNTRTQRVIAGELVHLEFYLECDPASLIVRVVTTGPAPDVNGYILMVSETGDAWCYSFTCREFRLAANDSTRIDDLRPFDHSVWLSDVAANCTASPSDLEPLRLTPVRPTTVVFQVTCR